MIRLSVSVAILAMLACAPSHEHREPGSSARRVVILAPAAAEMLAALGLADRVVAIGDYGPWPVGMEALPSVGGFGSPNVERILELEAELVLTTASETAAEAHRRLQSLGVRVLPLDTSTFEGVFESLSQVGHAFGEQPAAERFAARMREELDAIRLQGSELAPRRVLFVVGRDPLYVAGPGSHIDHMIGLVGGHNVAYDAISPYPQVSFETILERMPEVIIDTSDNRPGAPRGREVGAWGEWPFVPAVAAQRVYRIDPGRLVIPGIRLPEMTRLMGRLIHPEAFGEPDFAVAPPAER